MPRIVRATQMGSSVLFEVCRTQGTEESRCSCERDQVGQPQHPSFTFPSEPPEGDERSAEQWQEDHAIEALRLVASEVPDRTLWKAAAGVGRGL